MKLKKVPPRVHRVIGSFPRNRCRPGGLETPVHTSYSDCVVDSKVQPNKRSDEGIPRKTRNLRNTEGAMNFRERFEPLIGHFVLKYSFEWDTE